MMLYLLTTAYLRRVSASSLFVLERLLTSPRVIPQGTSSSPQLTSALCNKYGLAVGATFADFVRVLIIMLYPVVKPISLVRVCSQG